MTPRELLRLENVPAYQNKMFSDAAEAIACPRGDVVLEQDPGSGLVRNTAFDPAVLSYDASYQNEQGHSPAFMAHVAEVMALVGKHFSRMDILEIGCGKGAFVDLLRAAGHDARGIDPAYEGDSPHILARHFEAGSGVRGEAIVLRHVLEHIPEPARFLSEISAANGGTGRVYVEVPCLDWILRNHAWFDVFYEHVNYFRLTDFHRMFDTVIESGHLFGGQYIFVIAELGSLRDPAAPGLGPCPELQIPDNLFTGLDRCRAKARPGNPGVVWGAAAKGVMFAHHQRARGLNLRLAIDINPAKQGCFLAGSGLPVLAPRQALEQLGGSPDIFVMNSNYLPEIRAMGGPGPNYIAVDKT